MRLISQSARMFTHFDSPGGSHLIKKMHDAMIIIWLAVKLDFVSCFFFVRTKGLPRTSTAVFREIFIKFKTEVIDAEGSKLHICL